MKLNFKHEHIFKKESLIFNYRETEAQRNLYDKILINSQPLIKYAKVTTGVKPYQTGKGNPKQTKDIVEGKPFTSFHKKEVWNPLVRGTQINRYLTKWDGEYINYGEWLAEPRKPEIFFEPKLLIRRTDDSLLCTYDENNFVGINSVHCIQSTETEVANKFLLAQINSKLCNWFFRHENFHMVGKPLAEVKVVFVERLPIKTVNNQNAFLVKVDELINKNELVYNLNNRFLKYLISKIAIQEASNKLLNWKDLEFCDFIKEINFLIKKSGLEKLSKSDEMDWMDIFETKKNEVQNLKSEIEKTEKEIDYMVYELYGLTEEEIKIVEGMNS